MARKVLIALVVVIALLLAVLVGFIVFMERGNGELPPETTLAAPAETSAATEDTPVTTEPGTLPTAAPSDVPTTAAPTQAPTTVPTEPPETEPQDERFLLTFVGDCTLGSTNDNYGIVHSFIHTIGEDYDYPFANVKQYFEADDFTMANLECVFSDERMYSSSQFSFRGPTAYTNILTGSSVEAVTLANNHTPDFGEKGMEHTKAALDSAKVTYVEKNGSALYTTERGLTIGLYAAAFVLDKEDMEAEIQALRDQGADIVVVAFHWGVEGAYRPDGGQTANAHACIDAGADIVYGHHPHVLQKIEEYNGGIIYYSLGNFSFGGNNFPQDYDSAVLQQEVIRTVEGEIKLGKLTIIPVSCSSITSHNNFQPTPYPEDSEEYARVMSKLDGSFKGPNLFVNYEKLEPTTPATTPATQPPAAPEGTGEG